MSRGGWFRITSEEGTVGWFCGQEWGLTADMFLKIDGIEGESLDHKHNERNSALSFVRRHSSGTAGLAVAPVGKGPIDIIPDYQRTSKVEFKLLKLARPESTLPRRC